MGKHRSTSQGARLHGPQVSESPVTTPAEVSNRLIAAYHDGPIAPLRDCLDPQDSEGAYAIQAATVQTWLARGRKIIGRKIGLTSIAVQKQLGVDKPDFGVLFKDMQIRDGGTLRSSQVLQPKAEAEVAFVMEDDVADPLISRESLSAAIGAATVAIEIVDSRIADWKITFADTVADNGSSAFFVLGESRVPIPGLDLWTCGMVLEQNNRVVSLGAGAACLGHPLDAAVWLARTLATRGERLRAGDILLSGALGPMVALRSGDEVRATVSGLGSVSFQFVEG
jgi:2-keto-4-pentenoate hydratase